MSRSVKQFRRHQVIQFVPTVKAVRLEMLPSVDAAVVGILKQPGFEGSAIGVELVYRSEDVQEYLLDSLFCFPIIVEDCPGDSEDQSAVSFEQYCQGIVAAHTQRLH